jgi:hypothetical protein
MSRRVLSERKEDVAKFYYIQKFWQILLKIHKANKGTIPQVIYNLPHSIYPILSILFYPNLSHSISFYLFFWESVFTPISSKTLHTPLLPYYFPNPLSLPYYFPTPLLLPCYPTATTILIPYSPTTPPLPGDNHFRHQCWQFPSEGRQGFREIA